MLKFLNARLNSKWSFYFCSKFRLQNQYRKYKQATGKGRYCKKLETDGCEEKRTGCFRTPLTVRFIEIQNTHTAMSEGKTLGKVHSLWVAIDKIKNEIITLNLSSTYSRYVSLKPWTLSPKLYSFRSIIPLLKF
jgi:hypothetical protein